MRKIVISGLFLLSLLPVFSQTPVIIVNASNPISQMDKRSVRHIFLGSETTWADGTPVDVVIFRRGPEHMSLLKTFIYKTPSKFSLLWKKAIFTGMNRPPVIVHSIDEMILKVSSLNNAIGYISSDTPLNDHIKVLNLAQ